MYPNNKPLEQGHFMNIRVCRGYADSKKWESNKPSYDLGCVNERNVGIVMSANSRPYPTSILNGTNRINKCNAKRKL